LNKCLRNILLTLIWLTSCCGTWSTFAQHTDTNTVIDQIASYLLYRNHDTNYIKNYGDELALKFLATNKFNYFRIRDRETKNALRYRPTRDVSLGFGVAYKWFALDIAFALGLRNNSQIEDAGAFDFQGRLYSSKQLITFNLQYYSGYRLANTSGIEIDVPAEEELRSDIRTINFAAEYLYALNYTKFSMKAPFVFNEIQRKSAGSPILGATFGFFNMNADSTIIPGSLVNQFQPAAQMRDLSLINAAVNAGYMYTFVYKTNFFLSIGLIPGLNFNFGDFYNESTAERQFVPLNAHFKINSLNAIGYNGRRIFGGASFTIDATFARLAPRLTEITGRGLISLFVGYRFGMPLFKRKK
jgi:hypothetical protein